MNHNEMKLPKRARLFIRLNSFSRSYWPTLTKSHAQDKQKHCHLGSDWFLIQVVSLSFLPISKQINVNKFNVYVLHVPHSICFLFAIAMLGKMIPNQNIPPQTRMCILIFQIFRVKKFKAYDSMYTGKKIPLTKFHWVHWI